MEVEGEGFVIRRKTKSVVLGFLGSLAFVLIGAWMVSSDPSVAFWGYLSIVFFGLCAFVFAVQAFQRGPALIVNPDGITDRSTAVSAGFIPWADITGIGSGSMQGQHFIAIQVRDPEKYLNRGNALQRKLKRMNQRSFGMGIAIHTNSLDVETEELLGLLEGALEARERAVSDAPSQDDADKP